MALENGGELHSSARYSEVSERSMLQSTAVRIGGAGIVSSASGCGRTLGQRRAVSEKGNGRLPRDLRTSDLALINSSHGGNNQSPTPAGLVRGLGLPRILRVVRKEVEWEGSSPDYGIVGVECMTKVPVVRAAGVGLYP